MTWACENRFWHGTRTYIISNRTNPEPKKYIATLELHDITQPEKAHLINCVDTWPGGQNRDVIEAVKNDIAQARTN
jgi:hypothetical protein